MNVQSIAAIHFVESPFFTETQPFQNEKELKGRVKEIFSNEAIIKGLKTQDTVIIKYIYKNFFQTVRFMVTSNSGTQMDAEDIFQDGLMIIFKKISSGCLNLTCAFNTYLYSVCKHIWLQKLNKHGIQFEYKEAKDIESVEDNHNIELLIEDNEKFKLFQQHFEKLGEADQKMLKLFLKKVPLAEIAKIMGYSSYEYAKVRKYLIKEKLKNSILNDPRYREILEAKEKSMVFSN
jgi:RNA polymerase sigma factor (sigma-70 family)